MSTSSTPGIPMNGDTNKCAVCVLREEVDRERLRSAAPSEEPSPRKQCQKVPHDNPSGGYLHDENDDSPYDVDGMLYCGRCHVVVNQQTGRCQSSWLMGSLAQSDREAAKLPKFAKDINAAHDAQYAPLASSAPRAVTAGTPNPPSTTEITMNEKTLHNSDVSGARVNVPDIKVVGNGDAFQLLCKASSQAEGWMKSTKAMQVAGGCLVQVSTQQRNPDGSYAVAEALTFVPGVYVAPDDNNGRKLVDADAF